MKTKPPYICCQSAILPTAENLNESHFMPRLYHMVPTSVFINLFMTGNTNGNCSLCDNVLIPFDVTPWYLLLLRRDPKVQLPEPPLDSE